MSESYSTFAVPPRRWRRTKWAGAVAAGIVAAAAMAIPSVIAASGPTPWGSVEAPLPANAFSVPTARLDVPVCPAVGDCWALGSYVAKSGPTSGRSEALIEHLSGGEWSALEAPLPPKTPAGFTSPGGLACPTTSSCVAVGSYSGPSGSNAQGLIDTWSSGTWRSAFAPLPSPGSSYAFLTGVACASAGSCAAPGLLGPGTAQQTAFVDLLAAGHWTAMAAPGPGSAAAKIGPIACPTAGWCEVVGTYAPTSGADRLFAGTISHGTWTVTPLPLPANASAGNAVSPAEISCTAVGSCVAAGSYPMASGTGALVETLGGGRWPATEAPAPAGWTNAALHGIACTAADACTAIGDYTTSGRPFGMIDTLTGVRWTTLAAPLPETARPVESSSLVALSCVPPDACVAVGDVITPGSMSSVTSISTIGLIETGFSAMWAPETAPQPEGGRILPEDQGITCLSSSYCLAVGSYVTSAGDSSGGLGKILVTPRLVLTPGVAAAGTTVRASLSGFDAMQQVDVTWRTVTGKVLAKVVTDASGAGAPTFTVPAVPPGRYRVLAVGAGGPTAAATITVR